VTEVRGSNQCMRKRDGETDRSPMDLGFGSFSRIQYVLTFLVQVQNSTSSFP